VIEESKEAEHITLGKPKKIDQMISLLEQLVTNCKKISQNSQLEDPSNYRNPT
jgi:hypothetical protein